MQQASSDRDDGSYCAFCSAAGLVCIRHRDLLLDTVIFVEGLDRFGRKLKRSIMPNCVWILRMKFLMQPLLSDLDRRPKPCWLRQSQAESMYCRRSRLVPLPADVKSVVTQTHRIDACHDWSVMVFGPSFLAGNRDTHLVPSS